MAAVLFVSILLASCGEPPALDLSLRNVMDAGVLRVALDASFPPLESIAADGSLVGIDPDVARAVAKHIGVEVQFVNVGSDGLKSALLARKADAVISSFMPVREWSRQISYSQSYYDAGPVLVVLSGDATTGAIGVEAGGDGEQPARARWPNRVRTFETSEAALLALPSGELAGAVLDAPDLKLFSDKVPGAHALGAPLTSVPYVVAVRFGDTKLLLAIDEAITAMKTDGELASITAR